MISHTAALENELRRGSSYLDYFRGTDLWRTEIVCFVWAAQNLSSNSFSGVGSYFLHQAGLDSSTLYSFATGQYGINMLGLFGV